MQRVADKTDSYRSILRATSAFGGIEVVKLLVNLVRGKFVALILGPEGMGLAAMFNSLADTFKQFSKAGTDAAIVKAVAGADASRSDVADVVAAVRRMSAVLAAVGAIACAALSGWLSYVSFGRYDMWPWFVLLGVAVAAGVVASADASLLQGLHDVRRLSRSSLVGAVSGLCVGVPLYWFMGTDGIVPAIIAASLASLLFFRLSLRSAMKGCRSRFDRAVHMPLVRRILASGGVMMLSGAMTAAVAFALNALVRYAGSMGDVGLYQSANSVANQYVGMAFTAMSLDFFPRLVRAVGDKLRMRELISRQTEIVSLVITPLSLLLMLTAPLVIELLFSDDFAPAVPLMRLMAFGMIMKGIGYPLGYVAFACDNKRVFVLMECLGANLLDFACMAGGYALAGLHGLGMGFCASCALTLVMYYVVNRRLYGLRYSDGARRAVVAALGFGLPSFAVCVAALYVPQWQCVAVWVTAIVFVVSVGWSVLRVARRG